MNGGTATVARASQAGAASSTTTIRATIDCSLADGTVIVNNASAGFSLVDPNPADNASAASVTCKDSGGAVSIETATVTVEGGHMSNLRSETVSRSDGWQGGFGM